MDEIKYRIVAPPHGYGNWIIKDLHDKIVWGVTNCELNFCCGIHVIGNFLYGTPPTLAQAKQLMDAMKPYFRLALMTHNETKDGLQVIKLLKRLGAVELETVESNHINEGCGNIHLLMLHGTKPSINKPNILPYTETSTQYIVSDTVAIDEPF